MILTVSVWFPWCHKQYGLGSREHLQECAAWIMTETWHTHHYDTYAFSLTSLVSQAILLTESGTPSGVYCLDDDRGMGHSPSRYLRFLVWLFSYHKLYSLGSEEHLLESAASIMTDTLHTHHYDTYGFSLAVLVSQVILLRQSGTPLGVCCLNHDRDIAHSPL